MSVCGYAKILGGWVPELTPPPPRVAKQNPGQPPLPPPPQAVSGGDANPGGPGPLRHGLDAVPQADAGPTRRRDPL